MKRHKIAFALLAWTAIVAGIAAAEDVAEKTQHRYLIQRTFPAGALEGLDPAKKAAVNKTNAQYGVTWVKSYANADKTKTYCIYEGPDETAIRKAAKANGMSVDSIAEVPETLEPN